MWQNRIWDEMDRLLGVRPASGVSAPFPAINLWEDDENLYAEAELPGMTQDKIEVTVAEGDQLTIAGERQPAAIQGSICHRQESGYGRFSRTVTIPVVVDADKVEANYADGVLSLTLPKSEMAKPKRITVKAVESQAVAANVS